MSDLPGQQLRPVASTTTLAADERERMCELEAVIERGRVAVGQALREIRDRRLYRATHATFGAYVNERWAFSHAYRLIDEAHMKELLSPVGDIANGAQARELARLARVDGDATVEVVQELRATHGERVTAELIKRLVDRRILRDARDDERAAERARLLAEAQADEDDRWHVHRAALEEAVVDPRLAGIEPGSVDLVLADPPFEDLDLYGELARFARLVLRPGGSLIAMFGNEHLPEVLEVLDALRGHLQYKRLLRYELSRPRASDFGEHVFPKWKPLLWFGNGEPDCGWVPDGFRSTGRDKQFHKWGQNVDALSQLVKNFTSPGQLVADPFIGGGATAVAALRNGCRFVGSDRDPTAVAATRRHVHAEGLA